MSEIQQLDGSPVVRIDQDSNTNLEALFDSVLKPNGKKPLTVPYSMRKLPKSFFNPPATGSKSPSVSSISHSRENSGDSSFSTITTTTSTRLLQINHSRAHSSPASLQQTYASAQLQLQQHQNTHHLRQRSYDVSTVDELGPLPPGWGQATTPEGQVYFLNHNDKTTTWNDPRKSNVASSQQQQQCRNSITAAISASAALPDLISHTQQGSGNNGGNKSVSPNPASGTGSAAGNSGTLSPVASELALGPLPEGWEQSKTPEGELYFINHMIQTTTWFDPRIPNHLQRVPTDIGSPHLLNWMQQPNSMPPTLPLNEVTNLRIQSLNVERERLRLRRQELQQQQEQISRSRTADPFLSAAGVITTASIDHSRQESVDSGLGMSNNNYSLPHTPEDFLASIDDSMDGVSEGGTTDVTGLDSQDMSNLSDNIDTTDDLSSLPLDGFPSDILNDVHVQTLISPNHTENHLTWL